MFEGVDVVRGAMMCEYSTLKLGGPADYLATPASAEEVAALWKEARENGLPMTVIGHGSNLLVLDGGIRGLVIRIAKPMSRIAVRGTRMRVQAGAMLGAVAAAAADADLSGLEFASGIPGTVGGGIRMNAGAYDGELAQVVTEVSGILPDGTLRTFTTAEMDFGYRKSAVESLELVVTEAVFNLKEGKRDEIRKRMAELNARRAEKQPLDVPSAGSTFKRPKGNFAAALIDQCGLKGYTIGGARVSPKHAGFLVNTGSSAADYLALIRYVQQVVAERTGVLLEPEIRILGEPAEKGTL